MTASVFLEADRRIVRLRFARALACQTALDGGDDEAVHAFRLACKHLRYALERIEDRAQFARALDVLERVTDDLGEAHDCAQLAAFAAASRAPLVAARARHDRDRHLARAARRWRRAFRDDGEFAAPAAYSGFSWELS